MPRLRRRVDRGAEGGVQAAGGAGRLGRPLRHHGLWFRGCDRGRVPQVPDVGPALPRLQAGDVEPGRAHRPGRCRGRVPRPRLAHDLGQVPRPRHRRAPPGAGGPARRRLGGDLDHHALDHPGQPGDRLWPLDRLRALSGGGRRRGAGVHPLGQGGRQARPCRQAGRRSLRRRQRHRLDPARHRRAGDHRTLPASPGRPRPGLRLPGSHAGRRARHRRRRHGLRPHRPRAWGGRLSRLAPLRPPGHPRDGRRGRRLLPGRAAVRRAEGAGDRGQEGRQVRPGQRRGDEPADPGGKPAGARAAGARLSPLLALQGAGDLPQHAAVVHPHGRAPGRRPHPAPDRAAVDRRHRVLPQDRADPHPVDGRGPPGLADLAPTRLGHAPGHVRGQTHRRASARPGRQ